MRDGSLSTRQQGCDQLTIRLYASAASVLPAPEPLSADGPAGASTRPATQPERAEVGVLWQPSRSTRLTVVSGAPLNLTAFAPLWPHTPLPDHCHLFARKFRPDSVVYVRDFFENCAMVGLAARCLASAAAPAPAVVGLA